MNVCKNDGSELTKIELAGVPGQICLKCGQWQTDARMTPEQHAQVLVAYNKSRGLDPERGYTISMIGPGEMAAKAVPEEEPFFRHKHCLACGLDFRPPREKVEEPFCSAQCARVGWFKQYPNVTPKPNVGGMAPATATPRNIIVQP